MPLFANDSQKVMRLGDADHISNSLRLRLIRITEDILALRSCAAVTGRVCMDVMEYPALGRWLARRPEARGRAPPRPQAPGRRPSGGGDHPGRRCGGTALRGGWLGPGAAQLVAKLHAADQLASEPYDLHGLRLIRGVKLVLAGCSDTEGAAMLRHDGPSSFMQDHRKPDRVRLADTASSRVAGLRKQAENERATRGAK